jgi:hypothetical protein
VKRKKLLIIDQLTFMHLIYAVIYRMMGFNSIYLRVHSRIENVKILNFLDNIDISMVDYSSFRYYDCSQLYSLSGQLSRKVYAKIFDNEELKKYESLFQGVEDLDKKLKVVIIDMLFGIFGNLAEVLICAKYYKKRVKAVRICTKKSAFVKIALADEEFQDIKNISILPFPYVFSYLPKMFRLVRRTSSFGIHYLLGFFKHTDNSETTDKYDNKRTLCDKHNFSKAEVLFFVYRDWIAGGRTWTIEDCYMDDPSSPFCKDNVFHIKHREMSLKEKEKQKEENNGTLNEKNDVVYSFRPGNLYTSKKRLLLGIGYLFFRNIFERSCFIKMVLLLTIYNQYNNYVGFLSKIKNAKLALVFTDFPFPKCLSMAFSTKGIKSVAIQERLMRNYFDIITVLFDYYLVINKSISERIHSDDASHVKTVVPIGPIRSDLINGYKSHFYDGKIADIKRKYKLVIAYDFHSPKNYYGSKTNPINNWENNLSFYNDLIKLSKDIPYIYIIIRGKDDNWCFLPAFSSAYREIMKLPNMEISRDYSEMYYVSYKLASKADLIVAKHTSIGDEALASGIPVLFHDYSQNMKQMVSSVFNYDNYPLFVYSYNDLKARVHGIINGTDPLNSDLLEKMKREFFGVTKNETVKEKLHSELEKIYLNTIKSDKVDIHI